MKQAIGVMLLSALLSSPAMAAGSQSGGGSAGGGGASGAVPHSFGSAPQIGSSFGAAGGTPPSAFDSPFRVVPAPPAFDRPMRTVSETRRRRPLPVITLGDWPVQFNNPCPKQPYQRPIFAINGCAPYPFVIPQPRNFDNL